MRYRHTDVPFAALPRADLLSHLGRFPPLCWAGPHGARRPVRTESVQQHRTAHPLRSGLRLLVPPHFACPFLTPQGVLRVTHSREAPVASEQGHALGSGPSHLVRPPRDTNDPGGDRPKPGFCQVKVGACRRYRLEGPQEARHAQSPKKGLHLGRPQQTVPGAERPPSCLRVRQAQRQGDTWRTVTH